MTIIEAIHRVDALKPNAFSQHDKVVWLAALDGRVKIEVLDTHEDADRVYYPYTDDTALTTELLIPAPYDDVYEAWLAACIDQQNREIVSYNNDIATFSARYGDFKSYWNRTHTPKSEHLCFFGSGREVRPHAGPLSD